MFDRFLNIPRVQNIAKFWIWQISKYDSALNRWQAIHSVLNMPEYALTEFWLYIRFSICQDSEYDRVLNMQDLHRVHNMPQYDSICLVGMWICVITVIDRVLNISKTIYIVPDHTTS